MLAGAHGARPARVRRSRRVVALELHLGARLHWTVSLLHFDQQTRLTHNAQAVATHRARAQAQRAADRQGARPRCRKISTPARAQAYTKRSPRPRARPRGFDSSARRADARPTLSTRDSAWRRGSWLRAPTNRANVRPQPKRLTSRRRSPCRA